MIITKWLKYLLIVVALWVSDSSVGAAQSLTSEKGFALAPLSIKTQTGTRKLVVEIARTSKQRARGLMHRTELTDSDGMLFIWPDSALRHFWMKNTPLSLDILFFDNTGRLVHSEVSQQPFSEKLIPSLLPARYALELAAGRTAELGIKIGDKIDPLPKQ